MTKQLQVFTVVATNTKRGHVPAELVASCALEADTYYRATLDYLKRDHPEAVETHSMATACGNVTRSSGLMVPDESNPSGWRVVAGVTLRSHPVQFSDVDIAQAPHVARKMHPIAGRVGTVEEA